MKKLLLKISAYKLVFISVVFLVILSFGCGKKDEKEIKIGAILPMTGPSALLGEIAKNGLMLAEQDINSKNGIKGKKIKLIFEDGIADPNKSVLAFKKVITVDKIRFAITTHSSVCLALASIANKEKIVTFAHASHPHITQESLYVFRHSNIAEQESEVIVSFIKKTLNSKNIALAVMNDDYGLVFKDALSNAINNNVNDKFLNSIVIYEQSETDFKTVAQTLLRDKPQIVVIAGLGNGVGLLLRRLKEYGYKGNVIITLGAVVTGAFTSAGEVAKGVYYIGLDFKIDDEDYTSLSKSYKNTFHSDLSASSVLFYNSLLLLSYAIEIVGNNPESVSHFIHTLSSYQGIGEHMTIINGRDIVPPLKVIRNE